MQSNATMKLNSNNGPNPNSSPFEVLDWVKQKYRPEQIVMTTSFGMEGCALLNMLSKAQLGVTVADIDTGFLFSETESLRDKIKFRYRNFQYETWNPEFTPEEQDRDYGEKLWDRDPSLCCYLRKIRPLMENIGRFGVWITGIRKSQSESRSQIKPFQWDWNNNILKICPLANWERSDVWRYVDAHDVPYNDLHVQGYPSVGCTNCTRKVDGFVKLTTYSRSGRWSDNTKTECGLHLTPQKQASAQ